MERFKNVPFAQRSPRSYGVVGVSTNTRRLPSAVSCALDASCNAFNASASLITSHANDAEYRLASFVFVLYHKSPTCFFRSSDVVHAVDGSVSVNHVSILPSICVSSPESNPGKVLLIKSLLSNASAPNCSRVFSSPLELNTIRPPISELSRSKYVVPSADSMRPVLMNRPFIIVNPYVKAMERTFVSASTLFKTPTRK